MATCSSPVRHVSARKHPVRLACIRHAASVDPEPGSNSPPVPPPSASRTAVARRPRGFAQGWSFRCLVCAPGPAPDPPGCPGTPPPPARGFCGLVSIMNGRPGSPNRHPASSSAHDHPRSPGPYPSRDRPGTDDPGWLCSLVQGACPRTLPGAPSRPALLQGGDRLLRFRSCSTSMYQTPRYMRPPYPLALAIGRRTQPAGTKCTSFVGLRQGIRRSEFRALHGSFATPSRRPVSSEASAMIHTRPVGYKEIPDPILWSPNRALQ